MNPIDQAVRAHAHPDADGWRKLDERPYDFVRRRLSLLVAKNGGALCITKGAVASVLDVCTMAEMREGELEPLESVRAVIEARFEALSSEGLRTIAVAYRDFGDHDRLRLEDESAMTFLGLLVLHDPIKAGITETIGHLRELGVSLKVITGDNRWIAKSLGHQVGVKSDTPLTGQDLVGLSEEALVRRVSEVEVFAEIEPAQKERIIRALRKAGHVVGFVGDGINDATALHAADVGISVDSAVDVAKEAADIVLLEKDLGDRHPRVSLVRRCRRRLGAAAIPRGLPQPRHAARQARATFVRSRAASFHGWHRDHQPDSARGHLRAGARALGASGALGRRCLPQPGIDLVGAGFRLLDFHRTRFSRDRSSRLSQRRRSRGAPEGSRSTHLAEVRSGGRGVGSTRLRTDEAARRRPECPLRLPTHRSTPEAGRP